MNQTEQERIGYLKQICEWWEQVRGTLRDPVFGELAFKQVTDAYDQMFTWWSHASESADRNYSHYGAKLLKIIEGFRSSQTIPTPTTATPACDDRDKLAVAIGKMVGVSGRLDVLFPKHLLAGQQLAAHWELGARSFEDWYKVLLDLECAQKL